MEDLLSPRMNILPVDFDKLVCFPPFCAGMVPILVVANIHSLSHELPAQLLNGRHSRPTGYGVPEHGVDPFYVSVPPSEHDYNLHVAHHRHPLNYSYVNLC